MRYLEELESLLPTTTSKWSVRLITILIIPAFLFPHFLSPLMPKATEAEIVLMQILLPLLVALVGSLVALISILKSHHFYEKQNREIKAALLKYIHHPTIQPIPVANTPEPIKHKGLLNVGNE